MVCTQEGRPKGDNKNMKNTTLICNFENMSKFSESRNNVVVIFDGSQDSVLKDD